MGGQEREHWMERVRPAVEPDLSSFEGERYLTGIGGEIEAEHVHRYLFAAGLCAGKDVLDIACGEGYGSAMLARVAASVAGVDIDEPTIEKAREAYPAENLGFERGTCEAIPYKRDSFDVVVSFETIEHIEEQASFLREVRRVLRPGGVLICSTPDKGVYKAGQEPNPYHKRELTREEFELLLSSKFENVRMSGQRLVSGSVIARDTAGRAQVIETTDGIGFDRHGADEGAMYLIAVCSDGRLPRIDQSVMTDLRYSIGRVTSLQENERALWKRVGEAESKLGGSERALAETRALLERANATGSRAEEERARLSEDRGRLIAEREAAERERDAAIRDAAAASLEYERAVAVLDRVRGEMIEAREKAAAAQASEAASRAERETLIASTAKAIDMKDAAVEARRVAEVQSARATERARIAEAERAKSEDSARLAGIRERKAAEELAWMRATRSWRWSRPLRLVTAAGRSVGVKTLGGAALVADRLGLPGRERLAVARRAALFRASGLFDEGSYLAANPDVHAGAIDPAWHYAARGRAERRPTGGRFDTAFYLDSNPDVVAAGVHPFEHYLRTGMSEGRAPCPSGTGTSTPATSKTPRIEVGTPAARPVPVVETDAAQLARTKALAFYLPQYHPIPENDAWWGKGFTEWSNVTRGRPMFPGHAQPVLPGELGFYDLRLPEVRERQAELARAAGIHGFCYYHYWFNGRRVLERPLDDVIASASPDFPFCVCWANENWTRRWDGLEQEILLDQKHSLASDRAFILDLLPYLEDPRYVRVGGRAVVLVYRPDLMVNARDTAAVWRDECRRAGIGDIHLCAVQFRTGDPRPLGFDAAVEFPPHHFPAPEITGRIEGLDPAFGGTVSDYNAGARELIRSPRRAGYRLYRGVMPSWDNTARRMEQSHVFHGSSPELYEAWLRSAINQRQPEDGIDENLVFINAWNEWAEGTVLEPRRDIGNAYLRATARALGREVPGPSSPPRTQPATPAVAQTSDDRPNKVHPGSTIEAKIKRMVRTNPRINSFVNRHPELKSKAAAVLRGMGEGHAAASAESEGPPAASAPTPARPARLWSPGRDERVGENPRTFLIVSHDACLAGAQIVVLELLRELARDPGVRVYHLICGPGALEGDMRRLATTCSTEDLGGRGGRAGALRVALDALPGPVDVAICNTAATADAVEACAKRGIPTVSYIHELPTTIDTMLGGERTVRRISDHADRIVVVSDYVRDRLCERYGLARERLDVVHMGLFPSRAGTPDRSDAAEAVRDELGLDASTPIVLGCGTIHHRKGTDLWVASAARAIRRSREAGRPAPCFVWVGADQSGPELRDWCIHHAAAAGVAEHVRFIGSKSDTARYFAAADVFALSSREDPFPLVNLEAMICGTPVVAFEGAGGAPEALGIHGSEAGVVVPFGDASEMGDAIDRLLGDPALRERLGGAGRKVMCTRFGWERYKCALLDPAPAGANPGSGDTTGTTRESSA